MTGRNWNDLDELFTRITGMRIRTHLHQALFAFYYRLHALERFIRRGPEDVWRLLVGRDPVFKQKVGFDHELDKARRMLYHFPDQTLAYLEDLLGRVQGAGLPLNWVNGFTLRWRKEYKAALQRKALLSGAERYDFDCVFSPKTDTPPKVERGGGEP